MLLIVMLSGCDPFVFLPVSRLASSSLVVAGTVEPDGELVAIRDVDVQHVFSGPDVDPPTSTEEESNVWRTLIGDDIDLDVEAMEGARYALFLSNDTVDGRAIQYAHNLETDLPAANIGEQASPDGVTTTAALDCLLAMTGRDTRLDALVVAVDEVATDPGANDSLARTCEEE